jgi:hypothetical protein
MLLFSNVQEYDYLTWFAVIRRWELLFLFRIDIEQNIPHKPLSIKP